MSFFSSPGRPMPRASPLHTVALFLRCAPFFPAWSSSSLHSGRLLEHPWKVCPARVVLDDAEIWREKEKKKVHSSRRNPRLLRRLELMRGEKGEGKDTGYSRPGSFIPLPPSLSPRGYGNHRTGTSPGGTSGGRPDSFRTVAVPSPSHIHGIITCPPLSPSLLQWHARSFCLYYLTLALHSLP